MSVAKARMALAASRARVRKVRESLYDQPAEPMVLLLLDVCDQLEATQAIVADALAPRHRRAHGKRR